MGRLNWHDREAVRRWVIDLRVQVDDLAVIVRDMLAPARSRELGHATHVTRVAELLHGIVTALAYAIPPDDDGDDGPADPAGNGGAGPVH
jgi:hypothetical protein